MTSLLCTLLTPFLEAWPQRHVTQQHGVVGATFRIANARMVLHCQSVRTCSV